MAGADLIVGLGATDSLFGDGGNDRFVWNDGDGSDFVEGGADQDELEVNLDASAGDDVTITPNGTRVFVRRTNLTTFTLDVGTVETLDVRGGGGNDRLSGSPGLAGLVSLDFDGGPGSDIIHGGDGNDFLGGGDGADILVGELGADVLRAGPGDDLVVWRRGDGSDSVRGEEDWDTLQVHGSPTEDEDFDILPSWGGVMVQHSGGEYLQVFGIERMELQGDAGNDRFYGTTGLAVLTILDIDGGPGDDVLAGGDGDDVLRGGDDHDKFWGHEGDDTLIGGPGDDWFIWIELDGFDGSDTIDGDDGDDLLQVALDHAAGDNVSIVPNGSRLEIRRGNLTPFVLDVGTIETIDVRGDGGGDVILGSPGYGNVSLELHGNDGNDFLVGGDGPDELWGWDGDDTLLGGDGDDYFLPGPGSNVIQGGAGIDEYTLGRDAHDSITDYELWERIDVRAAFGTSVPSLGPGDDIFALGHFQQWTRDGDTILGFSSMFGTKEVARIHDVLGTFQSDPEDPFIVYLPEPGSQAQLAAGLVGLLALGVGRERSHTQRGRRTGGSRRRRERGKETPGCDATPRAGLSR
jgi:Ca2+-binding RTX toxin-like protein